MHTNCTILNMILAIASRWFVHFGSLKSIEGSFVNFLHHNTKVVDGDKNCPVLTLWQCLRWPLTWHSCHSTTFCQALLARIILYEHCLTLKCIALHTSYSTTSYLLICIRETVTEQAAPPRARLSANIYFKLEKTALPTHFGVTAPYQAAPHQCLLLCECQPNVHLTTFCITSSWFPKSLQLFWIFCNMQ